MGMTGLASRAFLLGANRTEVEGLQRFCTVLDERADIRGRRKGLITGERNRLDANGSVVDVWQFRIISVCTHVTATDSLCFRFLYRPWLTVHGELQRR